MIHWDLPDVHQIEVVVAPESIDVLGHVNNTEYLRYMEKIAWQHTQVLGLGWDDLHPRFPRLIYAATSGFGHTGPRASLPAYDIVVQAMGGLMSLTGEEGGPPTRVGTSIGDIAAGLFTTIGIGAALYDRERSGKGRKIDVSMLDSQVALFENAIARLGASGEVPGPIGARHPSITPFARFATADGPIVIAAGNDELFAKLCRVLRRSDLALNPDYASNAQRTENQQRLTTEIEAALAVRGTEPWLAELEAAGLVAPGYIVVRRGAGAYICGEESAMIESLEGKPGKPRHRPPFVAQRGLFDRPTLVNNVETVYWIPAIYAQGADWFASQGRHGRSGLRSFSVSGRVKNPGVHLAPAGITLNELINEYAGGMQDGHQLAGYLPGGASGGILPASKADIPLDFDTLQEHGCFIGSAAVVVFSDHDNLRNVATNLLGFFADESCGQCTPCRVGTEKMLTLLERSTWDVDTLERLSQVMMDASICGLGQAAPNPVLGLLRDFRTELAAQNVIFKG